MVVSRVRGCATSLCQSFGRYPPPHRILKGMIRSQHENRKPFAPNSLKIPTLAFVATLCAAVPIIITKENAIARTLTKHVARRQDQSFADWCGEIREL